MHATGLPPGLLATGARVLRPRDAAGVYANPHSQFRRLAQRGVLRRVAHGYYLVPPLEALADSRWRPPIEDLALAIAHADHPDSAALIGLSAARKHGVVPRAASKAWVAVPVSRRALDCGEYGTIVFVERDLGALDVVRVGTTLADGWLTSVEQTILDLLRNPRWSMSVADARSAARLLWSRRNPARLRELANRQQANAVIESFGREFDL